MKAVRIVSMMLVLVTAALAGCQSMSDDSSPSSSSGSMSSGGMMSSPGGSGRLLIAPHVVDA